MPKVQSYQTTKKSAPVKRREGDIANYSLSKHLGSIKLYKKQDIILSHYGLNYPSLRDFLTIYHNYTNNQTGISPYAILAIYNKSHGTVRCLYDRLLVLKDKGLVNCIDRKYYPTESAIKELSELLRSAG